MSTIFNLPTLVVGELSSVSAMAAVVYYYFHILQGDEQAQFYILLWVLISKEPDAINVNPTLVVPGPHEKASSWNLGQATESCWWFASDAQTGLQFLHYMHHL